MGEQEKYAKEVAETAVILAGAGHECHIHPNVIIINHDLDAKARLKAEDKAYTKATEQLKKDGRHPCPEVVDALKALFNGAGECPECAKQKSA